MYGARAEQASRFFGVFAQAFFFGDSARISTR